MVQCDTNISIDRNATEHIVLSIESLIPAILCTLRSLSILSSKEPWWQIRLEFPSGFLSRRAWLHLVVRDVNNAVIFESGGWDDDGKILENDNDRDSAAYEPHYQLVDNPDQVQIYEAIMGDVDGAVTTTLLRGDSYLKDNRLIPAGFEKATAADDIAVAGGAYEDDDFQDGKDKVSYLVSLDTFSGAYKILVELCYQSIGYR